MNYDDIIRYPIFIKDDYSIKGEYEDYNSQWLSDIGTYHLIIIANIVMLAQKVAHILTYIIVIRFNINLS